MRVVVTGGAGFIGSHLTDRLLREGHEVAVVDDLSGGRREQVNDQARFYQLDVTSDWISRVVARERPEVVFHLAAQIDVRRSVSDPLQDAEVNVLGPVQLLRAVVGGGGARFIFVSSGGAIYGDTEMVPARDPSAAAGFTLWRGQSCRRGVPQRLRWLVRSGDRGGPAGQRLRAPPGRPRGSRGGGNLHHRAPGR